MGERKQLNFIAASVPEKILEISSVISRVARARASPARTAWWNTPATSNHPPLVIPSWHLRAATVGARKGDPRSQAEGRSSVGEARDSERLTRLSRWRRTWLMVRFAFKFSDVRLSDSKSTVPRQELRFCDHACIYEHTVQDVLFPRPAKPEGHRDPQLRTKHECEIRKPRNTTLMLWRSFWQPTKDGVPGCQFSEVHNKTKIYYRPHHNAVSVLLCLPA